LPTSEGCFRTGFFLDDGTISASNLLSPISIETDFHRKVISICLAIPVKEKSRLFSLGPSVLAIQDPLLGSDGKRYNVVEVNLEGIRDNNGKLISASVATNVLRSDVDFKQALFLIRRGDIHFWAQSHVIKQMSQLY
jgi:hypothetical protein